MLSSCNDRKQPENIREKNVFVAQSVNCCGKKMFNFTEYLGLQV